MNGYNGLKMGQRMRMGRGPADLVWRVEPNLQAYSSPSAFTRASTARAFFDPSTEYPINGPRIEADGFLGEPATTNLFVTPLVPATQTINLATTGTYTCSVFGAGSATVAAATATITGGGAAVAATPRTFVVTGAGTVDVTIAGVVTFCQVEKRLVRTSPVEGSRALDVLTWPTSAAVEAALAGQMTLVVKVTFGFSHTVHNSVTAYPILGPTAGVGLLSWSAYDVPTPGTIHGYLSSTDGTSWSNKVFDFAANVPLYCAVVSGYTVGGQKKFKVGVTTNLTDPFTFGGESNFRGFFVSAGTLRAFYNNTIGPAWLGGAAMWARAELNASAQLAMAMLLG